ncbi:MAG: methyltransferase [Bacteroidales bacterium]|nr:methyltransferase [Bacteroidales bacterium]
MGQPSFRFKQFEVFHDRCAMKVGTDGVLLGAWVVPGEAKRILDVGTGSGLIALILAQRSTAFVDGVELDADAAGQAAENVAASPWRERVHIYEEDFNGYANGFYDLIISNPPFFRKSLKAPVKERSQARHTDTLGYGMLVEKSAEMLMPDGRFAVILPADSADDFEEICWQNKLYLSKRCEVISVEGLAPKRMLLEFTRQRSITHRASLIIETLEHKYSESFSAMTADLYLDK